MIKFGFAPESQPDKLRGMTRQAEELTKQAMALQPEERIALAEALLTSVDGFFATPELEAEWGQEIARRVKDFEEGRTQGVPSSEVFAKVRALLDEIHKVPPAR